MKKNLWIDLIMIILLSAIALIQIGDFKIRLANPPSGDDPVIYAIVGEIGMDNIALGPNGIGQAYYDFQQAILRLYQTGIILAINSKNNYEDGIEVIRKHPHMLLREHHLASLQINWDSKVKNMYRISEELNIGLDSFVYIDDSPQERYLLQRELPEVLTIPMPEDPAFYTSTLLNINDFNQLSLTKEDLERGSMYAAQRSRREFEAKILNLETYLDELKMILAIQQSKESDLNRIHQLIQRTNQFNLTSKRYSMSDLQNMQLSPDYRLYTLIVSDIFGDSGLTGLAIIHTKKEVWEIDTYLLSCRILGRTIENEFLNQIISDALKAGVEKIYGHYISTEKNRQASEFYKNFGFHYINNNNEKNTIWELNISDRKITPSSRFKVLR